jgi:hypothetical protein
MIEPFVREPAYLYSLEGYANHGFRTGVDADGAQALAVVLIPNIVLAIFDDAGNFLEVQSHALSADTLATANPCGNRAELRAKTDAELTALLGRIGIHDSTVRLKRFFLKGYGIGIVDFARFFQDVLQSPSAYTEDECRIAEREAHRWENEGIFELWLNEGTNIWMTRAGHIESS